MKLLFFLAFCISISAHAFYVNKTEFLQTKITSNEQQGIFIKYQLTSKCIKEPTGIQGEYDSYCREKYLILKNGQESILSVRFSIEASANTITIESYNLD